MISVPAQVDCSQLVAWLNKHELAALAQRHLDKQNPAAAQLMPIYWAHTSASIMKLALLESLLAALAEANIKCVLLKGIAFCLTIYPDPAVRPMSDLDLWIQRRDWPRTWQIMQQLGYMPDKLWDNPRTIPEHITIVEFYPRQAMQEDFLSVEIHSDLIGHPTHLIGRFPLADWWQRAVTKVWHTHTIHLLDPAAALLHTAVHQMYQHRGKLRLRWLLDLDQLVRGQPDYHLTAADWQRVIAEASLAGVLPALQSALQLCQTWFNTPLPELALDLLNHPSDPQQQAFFEQVAVPQRSSAGKVWVDLKGMSTARARFIHLRQKLLPSPNYMRERYQIPSPLLLPFYYLMRWGKAIYIIWQHK